VYDIGVRFVGIWEKLHRKANRFDEQKIVRKAIEWLIYLVVGALASSIQGTAGSETRAHSNHAV